ncbi:MAG: SDR family oxidoreductase [Pseudomonadota bacterium]|nr:SDR family oxidoreductase [Pseudomonadota bacterium]
MRTVVITGGGAGLGRAVARKFIAAGDRVMLLGRTAGKLQAAAVALGERAGAVPCDVSSPDSVRAAFDRITELAGGLDVLINNAALFEPFMLEDASDQQILGAVGTNLIGPMLCARAAIPLMGAGAHIINITSESVDADLPHLSVYQSTKAGLEPLSRSLLRELEPRGIRVTNVHAGAMFEAGKTWDVDPEARKAFVLAAQGRGFDFVNRPLSQFDSVAQLIHTLTDLPADLGVTSISLEARHS